MDVFEATSGQIGELYSLQRAAFVDEAMLYDTPHVPALDESFDDFATRHGESTTLVAIDGARIVGAVSLRRYVALFDVERLMTAPDRRGEGVATALMAHVDAYLAALGEAGVQLIVGDIAVDNQRLYERLGYIRTARWESDEFPGLILLRMTKNF